MIRIYESEVTPQEFAMWAVYNHGAIGARDCWRDLGELREAAIDMTEQEIGQIEVHIQLIVMRMNEWFGFHDIYKKVIG